MNGWLVGWLVGWLICLFHSMSTIVGLFNAKLSLLLPVIIWVHVTTTTTTTTTTNNDDDDDDDDDDL